MNNMGGATFQPAGYTQEQGVNLADPAIQNMNNFQNMNAMAQTNVFQQQQMQAAAQQANAQKQLYQEPGKMNSPYINKAVD